MKLVVPHKVDTYVRLTEDCLKDVFHMETLRYESGKTNKQLSEMKFKVISWEFKDADTGMPYYEYKLDLWKDKVVFAHKELEPIDNSVRFVLE